MIICFHFFVYPWPSQFVCRTRGVIRQPGLQNKIEETLPGDLIYYLEHSTLTIFGERQKIIALKKCSTAGWFLWNSLIIFTAWEITWERNFFLLFSTHSVMSLKEIFWSSVLVFRVLEIWIRKTAFDKFIKSIKTWLGTPGLWLENLICLIVVITCLLLSAP